MKEIRSTKRTLGSATRIYWRAFALYAAAAELARLDDWPDDAWKTWRYRRATLARLLAGEDMMQQVADAYAAGGSRWATRPPSLWQRVQSAFQH